MKTKVAFIINSRRKISSTVDRTFTLAKAEKDLSCEFYYTKSHKHATFLARDCTNDGFDCVVAVGGDGTINEVVNGMKLAKRTLGVYLGVVPNGTGNDFRTGLGKFVPEEFVGKLVSRQSKRMDLIRLISKESSKYSVNIAGIGFDGYVIKALQNIRQRLMFYGKFAYVLSIIQTFIVYKKSNVVIKGDDFEYSGKLLMMTVCNGPIFGHGLVMSPDAVIFDGKLNVTIFGDVSFIDYIKNLKRLKKGEHLKHSEVSYHETEKVSIEMTNRQLETEVDGEKFDAGNIIFEIVKGDLSLIF